MQPPRATASSNNRASSHRKQSFQSAATTLPCAAKRKRSQLANRTLLTCSSGARAHPAGGRSWHSVTLNSSSKNPLSISIHSHSQAAGLQDSEVCRGSSAHRGPEALRRCAIMSLFGRSPLLRVANKPVEYTGYAGET